MIGNQSPSLSVCVLGVGTVHAVLIASVLSVMVTLPAPDHHGPVHVPVAVRTALPAPFATAATDGAGPSNVVPGAPAELAIFGEGDADETALPAAVYLPTVRADLPLRGAVTTTLPLVRQAAAPRPKQGGALPSLAPVAKPDAVSSADADTNIVARLPDFMPDTVPPPKLKPDAGTLKQTPAAETTSPPPAAKKKRPAPTKQARPKPSPTSRPVASARPQPAPRSSRPIARTPPAPNPTFGNFFSGGVGRSMKEFPLPASR